jgi:hypothetical protein
MFGTKPRITVLAKANSSLLLYYASANKEINMPAGSGVFYFDY